MPLFEQLEKRGITAEDFKTPEKLMECARKHDFNPEVTLAMQLELVSALSGMVQELARSVALTSLTSLAARDPRAAARAVDTAIGELDEASAAKVKAAIKEGFGDV